MELTLTQAMTKGKLLSQSDPKWQLVQETLHETEWTKYEPALDSYGQGSWLTMYLCAREASLQVAQGNAALLMSMIPTQADCENIVGACVKVLRGGADVRLYFRVHPHVVTLVADSSIIICP